MKLVSAAVWHLVVVVLLGSLSAGCTSTKTDPIPTEPPQASETEDAPVAPAGTESSHQGGSPAADAPPTIPLETWPLGAPPAEGAESSGRPGRKDVTVPSEAGLVPIPFHLLDVPELPFTTYLPADASAERVKRGDASGVRYGYLEYQDVVEILFFPADTGKDQVESVLAAVAQEYIPVKASQIQEVKSDWAASCRWYQLPGGDGYVWLGEHQGAYFGVVANWPWERDTSAAEREVTFTEWVWRDTGLPLISPPSE